MGAGWDQPVPVACPLAQFCRVWMGGSGPPFHEDESQGTATSLPHPPGEKLWDLGSSHKVGIHSLLPVHSCNVALQVSEKEGGKSSEEKGGEEGGHAGEEPVPRWEWGGGS